MAKQAPEDLLLKIRSLPDRPGVYVHRDADGKPLYVGKAKNLRARVRSYFQESRSPDGRLRLMIAKIADVEVIVTDTEVEALILENNLIKELRPRYNINLRDDKSFPYICIKNERFPRVFPTRRVKRDGSRYFGPYADVKKMRLMLDTIRSIFMLRTCSLNLSSAAIESGRYKTCLEYHIHKCAGPCVGLQSEEAYDATIKQVQQLLNGKTAELVALLRDEMNHQANSTRFEAAAAVRDRIAALEKYASRQKMVSSDPVDRDLFAVARDPDRDVACAVLFLVREGKIVGRSHKVVRRTRGRSENELLQSFVERHYTDAAFVPDEVFLSHDLVDAGPLEAFLRQEKGRKVPFHIPARGEKAGLMRMVQSNAALLLQEHLLERARQEEGNVAYAVRALHEDLRLPDLPRRIECFDISHLAGTGTVASCVVFVNGTAKKSEYRSFNIRSTAAGTPDDFQAMREVVSRRFRRISADGGPWPDLVVVDGGKGQLSSAVEALTELEIYGQFPLVGLAKRLEEVFFPGDSESKRIPRTSASLQLLQRIRNEAHRFAVMRQRSKRSRDTLRSELLEIPGIGEKTAKSLLRTFGSVAVIAELDRETLAGVVGPARAGRIRRHFERDSRSAGT